MPKFVTEHKVISLIVGLFLLYLGVMFLNSLLGINVTRLILPSSSSSYGRTESMGSASDADYSYGVSGMAISPKLGIAPAPSYDVAPSTSQERLVVTNSSLSLLVKDVRESGDKILSFTKSIGGFMVSTSYNRPTESPFATVVVRVPSDKIDQAMAQFRSLGIKVTNENLIGTDITDQYVNVEERINTLEKTKAKFESILDSADKVQDILTVQRELVSIQTQIDALLGQKDAMEKNAQLSKITVYLSTDELALPYTPDQTFRPGVIFKLAVRSMLNSLRVIGEGLIWVVVYAVIWIPILLIYLAYRRWKARKKIVK